MRSGKSLYLPAGVYLRCAAHLPVGEVDERLGLARGKRLAGHVAAARHLPFTPFPPRMAASTWSMDSISFFSHSGRVKTHGAVMKPFSRSGEQTLRQCSTVPAKFASQLQFEPVGTWSKPALSSSS